MNARDVEQLSAYLDGQLSSADLARMEARLGSEADLRREWDDLRSTRDLLRRLPTRHAPRNFTLTRKMVGRHPPVPKSLPALRFASAAAAFLLVLTFAMNAVIPRFGMAAPAPAFGMGGGGAEGLGADTYEAPAAQEPAPAEPLGTAAPEALRAMPPTPEPLSIPTLGVTAPQVASRPDTVVPLDWQIAFGVAAVLFALVAAGLRWAAARRWLG